MHTQVVRPERLTGEELDDYLARGWYRIGQSLVTCRVLLFEGELRSTIWTRVPLDGFRFRRGLRRILSRNDRRFRVTIGPLVADGQHEALYRRYLAIARGSRSPTLQHFLRGDSDRDLFETREIAVWDGAQLVAFSWFDEGVHSVQSLLGVYDPDYARHSLGFYTLLLEMQYAQTVGMRYHYSGYVLPGDPAMDYKLRVGGLQFRDPEQGRWRPIDEMRGYPLPTDRLEGALLEARRELHALGVQADIVLYPMYEAPVFEPSLRWCLDQPLVIHCRPEPRSPTALLVTFDLDRQLYALVRCQRAHGTMHPPGDETNARPVEFWVVRERLALRSSPEATAAEVARILPAPRLVSRS